MLKNYVLKRIIGSGSFGTVYHAKEKKTGNIYALKKIQIGENKKRIEREIEALEALRHPHIISLYGHFEDQEDIYLITEYIKGNTLEQKIAKKGRLSQEETSCYMLNLLAATNHMHKRNLAHRDIKASNIFLDQQQKIYLGDFGTVKFLDNSKSTLTNVGSLIGTLAYASPEELEGSDKEISYYSADIYSLGVVMYTMLTGTLPFTCKNSYRLMVNIVQDIPKSPNQMYRDVDPALSDICMKALEKKPKHRYLTCSEMYKAIRDREQQITQPNKKEYTTKTPKKRNYLMIAGTILGISLATGYFVMDNNIQEEKKRTTASLLLQQGKEIMATATTQEEYMKAKSLLESSGILGNPEACYLLGEFYTSSEYRNRYYARVWYERSAESNYLKAMLALGQHHEHDNIHLALNWYKKAEYLGSIKANSNIVRLHEEHNIKYSSPDDFERRHKLLVDNGSVDAMIKLAKYYMNTKQEEQKKLALTLYEAAAVQKNKEALTMLILAYDQEKQITDMNLFFSEYFNKYKILKNNKETCLDIAYIYKDSYTLSENKEKEMYWYGKALDHGAIEMILPIEHLFIEGFGKYNKNLVSKMYEHSSKLKGRDNELHKIARRFIQKGKAQNEQQAINYYELLLSKNTLVKQAILDLSVIYRKNGKYASGIKLLRKIKNKSTEANIHYIKIKELGINGPPIGLDVSIRLYLDILKQGSTEALRNLVRIHKHEIPLENTTIADLLYESQIMDAEDTHLYLWRGILQYEREYFTKAKAEFLHEIKVSKTQHPLTYLYLGHIHSSQGKYYNKLALNSYTVAEKLGNKYGALYVGDMLRHEQTNNFTTNYTVAAQQYVKAAKQGAYRALTELKLLYHAGQLQKSFLQTIQELEEKQKQYEKLQKKINQYKQWVSLKDLEGMYKIGRLNGHYAQMFKEFKQYQDEHHTLFHEVNKGEEEWQLYRLKKLKDLYEQAGIGEDEHGIIFYEDTYYENLTRSKEPILTNFLK